MYMRSCRTPLEYVILGWSFRTTDLLFLINSIEPFRESQEDTILIVLGTNFYF